MHIIEPPVIITVIEVDHIYHQVVIKRLCVDGSVPKELPNVLRELYIIGRMTLIYEVHRTLKQIINDFVALLHHLAATHLI